MKIRYSELFSSFQGEADFTGMPTIWLRLFGCNLQCNGFGQKNPCDPSTHELPYKTIDLSKISTMMDLPVFTKGCDSGYSWSARFKKLAFDSNETELAEKILRLADEQLGCTAWRHRVIGTHPQLAFTGGEPMMQQKAMVAICKAIHESCGTTIPQVTIETNATKKLEECMSNMSLFDHVQKLHIAMSPKLYNVSGEKNAVDLAVIDSYCALADTVSIKFVHNGTEAAWKELAAIEGHLKKLPEHVNLFLMYVGATKESQEVPEVKSFVERALLHGYRISGRLHCHLLGNSMGT